MLRLKRSLTCQARVPRKYNEPGHGAPFGALARKRLTFILLALAALVADRGAGKERAVELTDRREALHGVRNLSQPLMMMMMMMVMMMDRKCSQWIRCTSNLRGS